MTNGSDEVIDTSILEAEEPIAVDRDLDVREDGVVISYSVRSNVATPIAIRIRDGLPHTLDGEEKGFNKHHKPRNWGFRGDGLVFEDVIPNDEELLFKFGVFNKDGVDIDDDSPDPIIESIAPVDPQDDDSRGLYDDNAIFRSSAVSQDKGFKWGGSPDESSDTILPPDGTQDPGTLNLSQESEEDSITPEQGPQTRKDPSKGTGPTDSTGGTDSLREEAPDETAQAIDTESIPERLTEVMEDRPFDETENPGPNTDTSRSGSHPAVEDVIEEIADDTRKESSQGSGENQASNVNPIQEDQGRVDEPEVAEPSKSTEIRLKHIESRMERFSALAGALEEFIDEHGDGTDVVTELRGEIDELEAELSEVGQRSEDAIEARSELREELREVQTRFEELETRESERITAATEELEEHIDKRLAQIDDELSERIDDEMKAFSELSDQLEGVTDRVEEVEGTARLIEDKLNDLEGVVDDIEAHHAKFNNRIEGVEESVGRLKDDIETTIDENTENIEEIADKLGLVEEELGGFRTSTSDELNDISERLEEVERIRDVIVEVITDIHEEVDTASPDTDERSSDQDSSS